MTEKELQAQEREKAQLQLLIGDRKTSKNVDSENVLGKTDKRFQIEGDGEFAVDPTHKEYKKVSQGHNKVVKRQKKY